MIFKNELEARMASPSPEVQAELEQLFERWNIEYPGDEPTITWLEFAEKNASSKTRVHIHEAWLRESSLSDELL